jgi:hypothetical protein
MLVKEMSLKVDESITNESLVNIYGALKAF